MSRITSLSEWLLRQATVWGTLAYLAFIALVVRSLPSDSWLALYFDGHFIKYALGELFFVGGATLVLRAMGLAYEHSVLENTRLTSPPAGGASPSTCTDLQAELETSAHGGGASYLVGRLDAALEHVRQCGSADHLESHLRCLADADRQRSRQSYGLVRVVATAMPLLGLLGGVVGATLAVVHLKATPLDRALPAMSISMTTALDMMGLSLSLSLVLMAMKYGVERIEQRLLARVDEAAASALMGRFQQTGSDKDPHVAAVRKMCEQMLHAVETAALSQAESISQSTSRMSGALTEMSERLAGALDGTLAKWSAATSDAGASLRDSLAGGVSAGLAEHAEALNRGLARHTDDLRAMLVRHAEILSEGCDQYGARLIESIESYSLKLSGAVQSPTSDMVSALEALTTILPETIERHTTALTEALEHHTAILTETETQLADENRRHLSDVEAALGEALLVAATRQDKAIKQSEDLLKEMQIALVEGAGATVAQQEQLIKQGEVLLRVVEATGQVRQLEESLNRNLASLGVSQNLEETLMSLSGTLQLLCARFGETGRVVPRVVLRDDHPQSQAA